MPPPPVHVYDHNARFNENGRLSEGGWGIHAGRLPMYSPVWTNDKPWAQKISSKFTSGLAELPNLVAYYLPFASRRSARSFATGRPSLTSTPSQSNFLFILLCGLWYTTSALSSNTGKAILNQFRYPITLTFVQFGFVAFYCLLFMSPAIRFSKLRAPTKAIIQSTLPMGMFQVGGHIFSSIAISRIPVSTVHTIKALSPLFTVAAYAMLFGVSYSSKTYISLLPLTVGVMLACSFDVSASNTIGLLCAFGSALVFVSSNIFFKKIMPSNTGGSTASSHKLDKMNLLLYSSGMAFLLMVPIWMYYDLPLFLSGSHLVKSAAATGKPPPTHSVTYYFFMNGTVHYAQNIIAFVILSSTSPVTYSIASLIKRVAVICIAIIWFKQTVHPVQAFGICMTFTGLYMYNNAKGDVEKGEKKLRRIEAAKDMMLPTTKEDSRMMLGTETPPSVTGPSYGIEASGLGSGTVYGRARGFSLSGKVQQHHRPSPSAALHITTSDSIPTIKESPGSPVDLYPSPPLSHDSPPNDTIPLPNSHYPYGVHHVHDKDGMHSHHHHAHQPHPTSVYA